MDVPFSLQGVPGHVLICVDPTKSDLNLAGSWTHFQHPGHTSSIQMGTPKDWSPVDGLGLDAGFPKISKPSLRPNHAKSRWSSLDWIYPPPSRGGPDGIFITGLCRRVATLRTDLRVALRCGHIFKSELFNFEHMGRPRVDWWKSEFLSPRVSFTVVNCVSACFSIMTTPR